MLFSYIVASLVDFSVKKVTAFIKKYVRDARLVEDNMTEMCYQLPDEAARQGDFEKLFLNLERSHKDLGISSFGISDTSLEEVSTGALHDLLQQKLVEIHGRKFSGLFLDSGF